MGFPFICNGKIFMFLFHHGWSLEVLESWRDEMIVPAILIYILMSEEFITDNVSFYENHKMGFKDLNQPPYL